MSGITLYHTIFVSAVTRTTASFGLLKMKWCTLLCYRLCPLDILCFYIVSQEKIWNLKSSSVLSECFCY